MRETVLTLTITELAEKIETVFKLHLWKVVFFSFSFLLAVNVLV